MKILTGLLAGTLLVGSPALAQQMSPGGAALMTSAPSGKTVTDWYKQDVYDRSNTKIGEIMDVLVSGNGQVSALIVGVGGFLGAGEKDVAVKFDAIRPTTKDNKTYLTLDTSKEALNTAPSFKYDRDKTAWVPADAKR